MGLYSRMLEGLDSFLHVHNHKPNYRQFLTNYKACDYKSASLLVVDIQNMDDRN